MTIDTAAAPGALAREHRLDALHEVAVVEPWLRGHAARAHHRHEPSRHLRYSIHMNRRSFVLGAPAFIRSLISAPRNGTLRLASFGAAGMAYATLDGIATHPNVMLACVAEVDSARLDRLKRKYPDARIYDDWRRMLDSERKSLDIACVGTPDHMHAPMAMSAMQLGMHVYVQKPLTHDIYEARRLAAFARKNRLVTQMGIQRHSSVEYRLAVQLIQSGAIGKVKEVHSWSEKKWGDPSPMPDRSDPVPATLNWDQWIGVASPRPFVSDYYHPGNWRKRIDFGTATFGDMGCHIYDPVFESLELTAPVSVRSEGPAPTQHNWAINSVIRYVFPATRYADGKTVNVTWYDGDERPPRQRPGRRGPDRAATPRVQTAGLPLRPRAQLSRLAQDRDAPRSVRLPGPEERAHPAQRERGRHL